MNKELLNYALRLLNRKDYTEKEIRDKLLKKSQNGEEINEVIEYLKEKRFIDDIRYAQNYLYFRLKRGYGKRRVVHELLNKGIGEDLIESVITSEDESAEEVFLKKLTLLKGKKNKRKKLFDFMYRRGFDSDKIVELLNKYEVKDDEDS